MAKGETEQRIDESWERLFKSYRVLKGGLQEENSQEEIFDISQDIPKLTQLIDSQANSQELELELKQLVMKYYWNGFYNGVENEQKN